MIVIDLPLHIQSPKTPLQRGDVGLQGQHWCVDDIGFQNVYNIHCISHNDEVSNQRFTFDINSKGPSAVALATVLPWPWFIKYMKIALLTLLTMIYNIYEDTLLLIFKVFEPAASAQSMSALIVPAMETCTAHRWSSFLWHCRVFPCTCQVRIRWSLQFKLAQKVWVKV